jgi:hypothetical protein
VDETRFTRLETRVDEIKEDVGELKAEQRFTKETVVELKDALKEHNKLVYEHVSSDNKIVSGLTPIMEDLAEMVGDYKYRKERSYRKMGKLKAWSIKLGVVSLVVGIAVGLQKLGVIKFID